MIRRQLGWIRGRGDLLPYQCNLTCLIGGMRTIWARCLRAGKNEFIPMAAFSSLIIILGRLSGKILEYPIRPLPDQPFHTTGITNANTNTWNSNWRSLTMFQTSLKSRLVFPNVPNFQNVLFSFGSYFLAWHRSLYIPIFYFMNNLEAIWSVS